MSNESGPWGRTPPEADPGRGPSERPPRRSRTVLWALFIAGLVGIVLALARAFPGSLETGEDWAYLTTRLGLVVLVAAGLFRVGRGALAQHLRYAAIWAAIFAVLALGVAYGDELAGVGQRVRLAFSGGHPVA